MTREHPAAKAGRYLREQQIANPQRITVAPMRGRTSVVNLLNAEVRGQWARRIAETGAEVVIIDCLRPIIDSLGLSEDKDTGRVLDAFDALLAEAGIAEGAIVHHMGHHGERSRGDSRLRDWPDAEWKLVRQQSDDGIEDPAAPRFFSAVGRDVEEPEQQVALDGRRLSIVGGSRSQQRVQVVVDAVAAAVTAEPGLSSRRLRELVVEATGCQVGAVDKARKRAISGGRIVNRGDDRKHEYHPTVTAVTTRDQKPAVTQSGGCDRVSIDTVTPPPAQIEGVTVTVTGAVAVTPCPGCGVVRQPGIRCTTADCPNRQPVGGAA